MGINLDIRCDECHSWMSIGDDVICEKCFYTKLDEIDKLGLRIENLEAQITKLEGESKNG